MYRKERLGATGADVAVSFSQAWQNDTALIAQLLCALADIRLCTRFVADVDELAVCDRHSLSLGLLLIHGVDIAVNNLVCLHVSSPFCYRVNFSSSGQPEPAGMPGIPRQFSFFPQKYTSCGLL